MPEVRGAIHTPNRERQLRDFSGLCFGTITPTDIDGLIEYKNQGYVIMELKHRDAKVLGGQKLALERMNDDFEKANKKSLCIIASHTEDDPEVAIDVANTIVVEFRYKKQWHIPTGITFTRNLIERFFTSKQHNFNPKNIY